MTDMRKKIAAIVADERNGGDPFDIADAIISELPDMVPDLVWEESEYGFSSSGTIVGFYSTWQDDGEYNWHLWDVNGEMLEEVTTGGSHDEAKDAANAHHRAQIMAALGVK